MLEIDQILLYQPIRKVRVGKHLSNAFTLHRGGRRGSVLSPILFLVVMDSVLTELQRADLGVSINGIDMSSLGHAAFYVPVV